MTEEARKDYALLRYGIIAPAVCHMLPEGKTLKEFFEEAAEKTYDGPNEKKLHFAASTCERWYYSYKEKGFDGLMNQPRSDNGKSRKIDPEVFTQIEQMKKDNPRMPATEVLRKLIDNKV